MATTITPINCSPLRGARDACAGVLRSLSELTRGISTAPRQAQPPRGGVVDRIQRTDHSTSASQDNRCHVVCSPLDILATIFCLLMCENHAVAMYGRI